MHQSRLRLGAFTTKQCKWPCCVPPTLQPAGQLSGALTQPFPSTLLLSPPSTFILLSRTLGPVDMTNIYRLDDRKGWQMIEKKHALEVAQT